MTDKICMIGLGYVGLPLAVAFAEKYSVIGFDINQSRIDELDAGTDKTLEVEGELLAAVKSNITYTSDVEKASDRNVYIITVPTPIDEYKRPDLIPLIKSSETIGGILNSGDIVIFESTVYPGATEEVCVPILEQKSGLAYMYTDNCEQIKEGFYCGCSPERINPGDKEHGVTTIQKVTSGSTPEIAEKIDVQVYNVALNDRTSLNQLYQMIEDRLIQRVDSLAKKEPTYRDFRAGDVPHSQADISKAQKLLGYQPSHKIEEGLDEAMDWYVESLSS